MKRLLDNKLNIQVFSGQNHAMLSEGEQARYSNTILEALGGADAMPLQRGMQVDSSPNTENAIFYDFGKLTARERVNITDDRQLGQGITPIPGVKVKSVSVSPKWLETPLYIDDREFDKSQLAEESAITKAQVTAIYTGAERELCTLFKDCFKNKKRRVKNSKNIERDLNIPAKNFFGDKIKTFDDPINIKSFRLMMRTIQALAKRQQREIFIVSGLEGGTELNNCEKFTSKDYNNFNGGLTPNQTGINLDKLLGGTLEQLIEYDNIFYETNDIDSGNTGVITVFIAESFGQKAKKLNIKPTSVHITHMKQYFLDVEIAIGTELVQAEGVFFFTYKRDTSVINTVDCLDVEEDSLKQKNVEPSKEDKILKILEKISEENKEIKAKLNDHEEKLKNNKVKIEAGESQENQLSSNVESEKSSKNTKK